MIAIILLAVLLGFGLMGTLASKATSCTTDKPLAVEKVVNGLELTMSLQKATFYQGEPVYINFTVTNIGTQTINLTHSFPEYNFIVSNSSNDNLYQWVFFKAFPMIVYDTSLGPGQSYTNILTWPQTCNQTIYDNEGIPVSPGEYSIVGVFYLFSWRTDPLEISIGTVCTTPTINRPSNVTCIYGVSGNSITWTPSSQTPDHYTISVDGSSPSSHSWNGSAVTYNLDGLSVGVHTINCTVYDSIGRSASSTVAVIVQSSSAGGAVSMPSAGTFVILGGGVATVFAVALVAVVLMKRK
jgi:hypothetical protein